MRCSINTYLTAAENKNLIFRTVLCLQIVPEIMVQRKPDTQSINAKIQVLIGLHVFLYLNHATSTEST